MFWSITLGGVAIIVFFGVCFFVLIDQFAKDNERMVRHPPPMRDKDDA